jgi:hypothetical protein
MRVSLRIPVYAKLEAKKAIVLRQSLPESKRFGLSREEANNLGIFSGVDRAYQIINHEFMDFDDVKAVARFYQRFKNCHTPKCDGAISLWGGRRFGQLCVDFIKDNK